MREVVDVVATRRVKVGDVVGGAVVSNPRDADAITAYYSSQLGAYQVAIYDFNQNDRED